MKELNVELLAVFICCLLKELLCIELCCTEGLGCSCIQNLLLILVGLHVFLGFCVVPADLALQTLEYHFWLWSPVRFCL